MKRQAYKRNLFFVLSMLLSPVFAQTDALSVDVPNLSPYADTEATTNIFLNGGDTDDRIFRLSLEQEYSYAAEIMEMVEMSPEWDDCLDESDTNEVEVLFPTMTSVFACEMPSNSCAFAWTVEERSRAFDDFLVGLSQTNRILVSESSIRTGAYAFICCGEKGYTNVVNIAQNLVRSGEAPCKDSALEYLLRTAVPSDEMTAVILSVQSNKFDFAMDMRNRAVSTYVESLRSMSAPVSSVVTNAARAMYENRGTIDHLRAVDLLMQRVWPDYVSSSNRLVVAELAIAQTLGDERPEGALVRNYFAPITNQLMNAAQPLLEVEALRGL